MSLREIRWRLRRARGIYRKEHRLWSVFDALKHGGGTAIGYPLELMQACGVHDASWPLWSAWVGEKIKSGWNWKAAHVEAIRRVTARESFCIYVQREEGMPAPPPVARCGGPIQHGRVHPLTSASCFNPGAHDGGMAQRSDLPWRQITDPVGEVENRFTGAHRAVYFFDEAGGLLPALWAQSQVRGVVAGLATIPIAQVGSAIRDAGAETDSHEWRIETIASDLEGQTLRLRRSDQRVVTGIDPAGPGEDHVVAATLRRERGVVTVMRVTSRARLNPDEEARIGESARRAMEQAAERAFTNFGVNCFAESPFGPPGNWGEDGAAPIADIRAAAAEMLSSVTITPLGREVARMAEAGESLASINSWLGERLRPVADPRGLGERLLPHDDYPVSANHLPAEGFVRDEREACWRRDPPSPPDVVQDIEIAALLRPVDAAHPITFERIMAQRAEHTRNQLDLGTPFVEFAARRPDGSFEPYRVIGRVDTDEGETGPEMREMLRGNAPGLASEYVGGRYGDECDRRNPDLRGDDEMIDGLLEDVGGGLEQLRQLASGEPKTKGDDD